MIPNSNIFSWALPSSYPYFYGAWLGEALLYVIYYLGGLSCIVIIRNFLALIAFFLTGMEAYRKSKSWRIAGLVMIPTCAMASSNLIVRPQMWTWVLFTLFYLVLNRFIVRELRPGWLLLCPILMLLWTNVHGSYVLGIVMIVIFLIGESVNRILSKPQALSRKEITYLVATSLLTLGATILNPKFIGIFGYVTNMLTNQPSQQLGTEWQPPLPKDYAMIFFFLSILVLLAVLAYSRYKLTWTETFLLLGFLWLALSGVRYVIWFGIIMTPILAKAVSEIVKGKSWMAVPPRNILNVVLVVFLIIPVILFQPWFLTRFPLPQQFRSQVLVDSNEGVILSGTTPLAAVDYLKQHPGGKLFDDMAYGSYIIWEIPEQKVFVDPRIDLYPYQTWVDYKNIILGIRSLDLLNQYGVNRIILDKKAESELVKVLEKNGGWKLEYEDEYSQIWFKEDR
jgi:hypothetical protein